LAIAAARVAAVFTFIRLIFRISNICLLRT